jgi:hypothetical protein
LQLASWRGWRYQISARTSAARQRVIPGRGNRTVSTPSSSISLWKRTFQCHHGTEEKAPGRWNRRKSPGTVEVEHRGTGRHVVQCTMTVTALLRRSQC